jgi:16S rRNA (guanine527-N7)-methyltransferase
MSVEEQVVKRASSARLSLPDAVVASLGAYLTLLRRWNSKISLTALPVEENGDEAIDRLLIEPIVAATYLPRPDSVIVDIGSGSGSPAIPMKVVRPGIFLRMVESKTRKAAFLREAARTLQLDRTQIDAFRYQELLGQSETLESADVLTLRAVRTDRATLVELQNFLRPGGLMFLFGAVTTTVPDLRHSGLALSASHELLSHWGSRLDILQRLPR